MKIAGAIIQNRNGNKSKFQQKLEEMQAKANNERSKK